MVKDVEFFALHSQPEPVKSQVKHRCGVEGQELTDNKSTDNTDPKRLPELRPSTGPQGQRQSSKKSRHGGHQDWAKAEQTCFKNGISRALPLLPFHLEGEIDHHDGVLFDNADQQHDADDGNHVEIDSEKRQGQHGAHARRR